MDLLAVVLFFWARWLSGRPGAPAWLRHVGPALVVVFVVSVGGTLLGLRQAFVSAGEVDAAHKAQHLSEGISRAMSFTAAGLAFDLLVLPTLAVFTWRLRRTPS